MTPRKCLTLGLIGVLGLIVLIATQTTLALPTASIPTVPVHSTIPPPPALPANFRGVVYVDGAYVAEGTEISVEGDGGVYAQSEVFLRDGLSRYVLNVPGDNPLTPQKDGGSAGEVLKFWIGAQLAEQESTWEIGKVEELTLSIGAEPPTPIPTSTSTATATETATATATATATEVATPEFKLYLPMIER